MYGIDLSSGENHSEIADALIVTSKELLALPGMSFNVVLLATLVVA